ncbi:phage antirepressor N-terminal domain-containing protein [uncultured Pseudodesulfovibrio sp.]|uniref:phage antirepressor N-terminal domain-containing protein n=1 Tax=uncultured Pseudodesulfovibrio sp. TaxID=2035858 RepID=UPI0029C8084A|nr:phage antirepressor N-terminal domain-containing protein [uncultured Pseudodesulfovibrio sp.]
MVFAAPILVAVLEGEENYVSVKHIYDAMGINWPSQYTKIIKDESLSPRGCVITIPYDGGDQNAYMIPLDMMSGWLMGIQVKRFRPTI